MPGGTAGDRRNDVNRLALLREASQACVPQRVELPPIVPDFAASAVDDAP